MEKLCMLAAFLLLLSTTFLDKVSAKGGRRTPDGLEEWGYEEVRPGAHMFWWLYRSPNRVESSSRPWPIILWLQGGPGASGVGIGNFEEIGPLDVNLKPRNSTWLQKADLLFVDAPVGTGYSFVENDKLFVKSDEEAATDLTILLENIFNRNENLSKSPLYIVAESYGGKFAVDLGLSTLKAIEAGRLKIKLGGVVLGDSWISPEDYVLSWGPLLKDLSRLDNNGLNKANSLAQEIKQQLIAKQYENATETWSELEQSISDNSDGVDFYNFLLDDGTDKVTLMASELKKAKLTKRIGVGRYSRYLSSMRSIPGNAGSLSELMDGVIKQKLKIIPEAVSWGAQSDGVFKYLQADFMKPRINEVDELLAKGVNVTIYNGQLDLIVATKGTEAWIEKLKWKWLKDFLKKERTPLYCGKGGTTLGFTKSCKNLNFYWILGAGHFVPVDQPCIALNMVAAITQSPAATVATKTLEERTLFTSYKNNDK